MAFKEKVKFYTIVSIQAEMAVEFFKVKCSCFLKCSCGFKKVDNELPMAFKLLSSMALDGVTAVAGDEQALAAAVEQHFTNFDM